MFDDEVCLNSAVRFLTEFDQAMGPMPPPVRNPQTTAARVTVSHGRVLPVAGGVGIGFASIAGKKGLGLYLNGAPRRHVRFYRLSADD
jgi:hypothetical protein